MRRILGRVAVRSVLGALVPFVAVPVTATWNALLTWKLLREARIRAMGPSAVAELVDGVFSDVVNLFGRGACRRCARWPRQSSARRGCTRTWCAC